MKVNEVAENIRKAYDMAVLYNKNYRLVIALGSNKYWLESTDAKEFYLANEKEDQDLSQNAVKNKILELEETFEEYKELAGKEVSDPDNDRVIPPVSPVLNAKKKLMPIEWYTINSDGWGIKTLGPSLVFIDMQAEHHNQKQLTEIYSEEGEAPKTYIYIFPNGYIEKAVIHIAVKESETELSKTEEPFTITTVPNLGIAEIESGYQEVTFEKQ